MNFKNYILETETTYNNEYQADYYRGVILDKEDNIIQRCPDTFRSREMALEEARRMANAIDLKIDFSKKIWLRRDSKSYSSKAIIFCTLATIIFSLLLVFLLEPIYNLGTTFFVLFIFVMMIIFLGIIIAFTKSLMSYFIGFIYEEGELYRVVFPQEKTSLAQATSSLGLPAAGAYIAVEGAEENIAFQHSIKGIKDVYRFYKKPIVWKFQTVTNIKTNENNSFEITAYFENASDRKIKHKTFIIKDEYDEFESLINCFKILQK